MEEISETTKTIDTNAAAEAETAIADTQAETAAEDAFVPDDALIKRGILAGMEMEDIRSFGSKEAAERIIAKLESKAPSKATKAEGDDGDGVPAIDFDGLSEDAGYDPVLLKGINSLKAVVEAQGKFIQKLTAGKSPSQKETNIAARRNIALARPNRPAAVQKPSTEMTEADIANVLFNQLTK